MALQTVLARSLAAVPGYPDVGATRAAALDGAPLPAGWNHLRHSGSVGTGPAALEAAEECIRRWGMHRGSGITVAASADRADVGVTMVSGIGLGPLRLSAPCRVLWTTDDAADPDVRGFGYGTLPGHPETGEEAFVARLGADGVVRMTVLAFSRPGPWYVRLAGPVVPLLQGLAARAYVRAVRRACARAAAGSA